MSEGVIEADPSNEGLGASWMFETGVRAANATRLLRQSTVAVVGLHGAGSFASLSLGAMGVGQLLCIDPFPVTSADPFLSPLFREREGGEPRAAVAANRIAERSQCRAVGISRPVESDEDMAAVLEGSTFAVCAVDPSAATLLYRLNRVARRTGLRWTGSHGSAFEAVLGPTIYPGETACYVCYKMRSVACADDPATEFAFIRGQERANRDDSANRENTAAAAGLLGQMLALEAVKIITGLGGSAKGAIVAVDTLTLNSRRHAVLRVPSCPVCGIGAGS